MRVFGRKRRAELLQLRADLRTTVAMLSKVAHGTHMEGVVEPNLRPIYKRLSGPVKR